MHEEVMRELLRLHLSSAGYGFELGAVDYLRKPVRLEELLAAVGRHLAPPPS